MFEEFHYTCQLLGRVDFVFVMPHLRYNSRLDKIQLLPLPATSSSQTSKQLCTQTKELIFIYLLALET